MKGMFVLSLLSFLLILVLAFDTKGRFLHPVKDVWDAVNRVGLGLLCAALCVLALVLGFSEVHP